VRLKLIFLYYLLKFGTSNVYVMTFLCRFANEVMFKEELKDLTRNETMKGQITYNSEQNRTYKVWHLKFSVHYLGLKSLIHKGILFILDQISIEILPLLNSLNLKLLTGAYYC